MIFIKDKSVCYELGCSTGTLLNQISKRHQNKRLNKFIGIDIEKDMIKFAKKIIEKILNFFVETSIN